VYIYRERKRQKEREDNWKLLHSKVERMKLNDQHIHVDILQSEEVEVYNTNSDYTLDSNSLQDDIYVELEDLDISDSPIMTEQDEDDIHPDIQQFDSQPTQYQVFRRKSIIPVDESVYNELSRHVSLDDVLNLAPGASSQTTNI
jgi:serine/threonine-protein phosphatase 2A regulatory subunit B'